MKKVVSYLKKGPMLVVLLFAVFALILPITSCVDEGAIKQPDEAVISDDIDVDVLEPEVVAEEPADVSADLAKKIDDLAAQTEAMKAALEAKIVEMEAKLKAEQDAQSAAAAALQAQLEEQLEQEKEIDAAMKEQSEAVKEYDDTKADLEESAKEDAEQQEQEEAEAGKAISEIQVYLKTADSTNGAESSSDGFRVEFCKLETECRPFPVTHEGAFSRGKEAIINIDATDLTTDDLYMWKWCNSGEDNHLVGSVMLVADGEKKYLNPAVMVDVGANVNECAEFRPAQDWGSVGLIGFWDEHWDDNNGVADEVIFHLIIGLNEEMLTQEQAHNIMTRKVASTKHTTHIDKLGEGELRIALRSRDNNYDDGHRFVLGSYFPAEPGSIDVEKMKVYSYCYNDDDGDNYETDHIQTWLYRMKDLLANFTCFVSPDLGHKDITSRSATFNMTLAPDFCGAGFKGFGKYNAHAGTGDGTFPPLAWYEKTGQELMAAVTDILAAEEEEPADEEEPPEEVEVPEIFQEGIDEWNEAVGYAIEIGGTEEDSDDSILGDLDKVLEIKVTLLAETGNICYQTQIAELGDIGHEITLAFINATTAAKKGQTQLLLMEAALVNPNLSEEERIAKAEEALDVLKDRVDEAKGFRDSAEAALDKPLMDCKTAAAGTPPAEAPPEEPPTE